MKIIKFIFLVIFFIYFGNFFVINDEFLQFTKFIKDYNRTYQGEELFRKFTIFKENIKRINELNAKYPGVKFGINKFADLSKEEFRSMYLSKIKPIRDPNLPVAPLYSKEKINKLPTSFDWRKKGAVTPVKNQVTKEKLYNINIYRACVVHVGLFLLLEILKV